MSSFRNAARQDASALKNVKLFLREPLNTDLTESLDRYLKGKAKSVDVVPSVLAYILSNWILNANSELNGYGFPFDRSHLVFYSCATAEKVSAVLFPRRT
jgi:hypothetical protein